MLKCSTPLILARALSSSARRKSVTTGLPFVKVPVLTKMTASTLLAISSVSPPFIRTPHLAATPVPTMIALGVANPSAQGQLIRSAAMPKSKEKVIGLSPSYHDSGTTPLMQQMYHTKNVRKEIATTTGTKTPAIVSARF